MEEKSIIKYSDDYVATEFIYEEEFLFQRLLKDQTWYVTYQNHIINHGMYRHDLMEWIDVTYFKKNVTKLIH